MAEGGQGVSLGVSLCAFFRLLCTLCAYGPEFSTPPSPKSLKIHRNCVADGKGRVPYSAHDNAFFRQHLLHFLLILQPSKLRKIADGGGKAAHFVSLSVPFSVSSVSCVLMGKNFSAP